MLSRLCSRALSGGNLYGNGTTVSFTMSMAMAESNVKVGNTCNKMLVRGLGRSAGRTRNPQATRTSPTLWERAMAPVGPNAFGIGKGAVAGASLVGIGSLCYYGLGLSSRPGALENSHFWPQHVKDRIKDTYMYFGSTIALSAGSAMAIFRSPTMMNLVTKSGWMAMIGSLVLLIGSGAVMRSIEYTPGLGTKQMAWMVHSAILGGLLAPMCFLGGPILMRAAWYTAGIVGGLSTIAVCAPSGEFLAMGAPLGMGLGVVFASSVAGMFLPPTTALGAGLYSIALYGGLVIFGGLLVYDTQRIIHKAEQHPTYGYKPFDPINAAISIYMDTVNIFIRMATILAGGGGRRK